MKKVFIPIIAFFIFYLINLYILSFIGTMLIPGGDEFQISYHSISYSGIAALASIVITCTYIIVEKINELLKELRK